MPQSQHLDSQPSGSVPLAASVVTNVDTGRVLVFHLRRADTFWLRLKGLIPTGNLHASHGLLLTPCKSIHTFFMKYPIDVAYLNSGLVVVGTFFGVKPWRILPAVRGTKHVLEMPKGTLANTGTLIGHKLELSGHEQTLNEKFL